MRGLILLVSLVVSVVGAVFFGSRDQVVWAVLAVFPGYFVVAYLLVLIATFIPGTERQQFQSARHEAMRAADTLPGDTVMHPAYAGALTATMYSGDGFLGWPENGDLVFRALSYQPHTYTFPPRAFRGFKVEPTVPEFFAPDALIKTDGGPVLKLDGGPGAGMMLFWVQPHDSSQFIERLLAEGVPDLASTRGPTDSST